MKTAASKTKQRGLTAVETAVVAAVFLTVLFGVIEISRLLWTWNVLDEVTRRAARLATVCPVTATANVQNTAVFGGAVISGLAPTDVIIEYLNANGGVIGDPVAGFTGIAFVRARIANTFQYRMLIPFNVTTLTARPFTTTVVAESRGVSPAGTGTTTC